MSHVSLSHSATPYVNPMDMTNVIDASNVVAEQKGKTGRGVNSIALMPIVQDDLFILPPGKGYNASMVPTATRKEPAAFLTSQTTRLIDGVTFRDCKTINDTEVVCRANKYQIIPPQPDGTPEAVLRQFAKFPVTVGEVKGTIQNGRTTVMDIEVNSQERGNGLGRALVESINSIGQQRGATCQVAKNLFDIEAGNSVGPKKFWSSLGYTVKKQGDYLNAYRGDCAELQPRQPRQRR
ncbi:MAG: hypothetical protein HEQ39_09045 [Rhizobacter sp.]